MVALNVPLVVPPGCTLEQVRQWSMACATGKHNQCGGRVINPDPTATGENTALPCQCTICADKPSHQDNGKGGRPWKNPVEAPRPIEEET
ncbi:hypothetical protein ETD86_40980 [Nonomuraea turkmeniaca]|uniref:Uncharacterized protein n=1 Tax=Nonomuraea turkmeniaca TaxID=103838 RepID=A0A5S4F1Z1_9ACTN|nr:hypothetical protein [Nonomuraea turkmeniaca]TMR10102.1 hypothetical protein ETD86_40980 [Nonomuraea turkmeniaca]